MSENRIAASGILRRGAGKPPKGNAASQSVFGRWYAMAQLLTLDGKRSRTLFAGCLVLPFIVGAFASFFLYNADAVYANLKKPEFSPPYALLTPSAAVLALLTGYASYRVAVRGTDRCDVRLSIVLYAAHLIIAFAWPVLFFGFEKQSLALYVLFVLLILLTACIYSFVRVDETAAYLLLPGFAGWCYLTAVNYGVVLLQKISS